MFVLVRRRTINELKQDVAGLKALMAELFEEEDEITITGFMEAEEDGEEEEELEEWNEEIVCSAGGSSRRGGWFMRSLRGALGCKRTSQRQQPPRCRR